MNEDCAWICGKLNFLHILKQKLEKSDFQFLIKTKKGRREELSGFLNFPWACT